VNVRRLVSDYRWPIYLSGLLAMPIVATGVLVYFATRPEAQRPMKDYYQTAQKWDADEAVEAASRQLGWTVRYEVVAGVPHTPGTPRPVDVRVQDREGKGVAGLTGRLFAIRPSEPRLNQTTPLVELPQEPGVYRTLVKLDRPGEWELRLDAKRESLRFVHAARVALLPDAPDGGAAK
jgi:hypothetical protein